MYDRNNPRTEADRACGNLIHWTRAYLAVRSIKEPGADRDMVERFRERTRNEARTAARDLAVAVGLEEASNVPPDPPQKADPVKVAAGIERDAERVRSLMLCGGHVAARVLVGQIWTWVGAL